MVSLLWSLVKDIRREKNFKPCQICQCCFHPNLTNTLLTNNAFAKNAKQILFLPFLQTTTKRNHTHVVKHGCTCLFLQVFHLL
jgi:hypothetical protein